MKKVIRLSESDLVRLVKRVIKEQITDIPKVLKERGYEDPQGMNLEWFSDDRTYDICVADHLGYKDDVTEKYPMYQSKDGNILLYTDGKTVVFVNSPAKLQACKPYDLIGIQDEL